MFVEVVKYSDKYIAVFGDTSEIQDSLIEMGAHRNPRLIYRNTTKSGWRIPIEREAELYAIIDMAGLKHASDDTTAKNFPTAVKSFVAQYGKDALISPDSVAVLADMNAFEELPSLKNVYRILLMEGFIEQMANKEKWDRDCNALSFKIKNDYAISNIIIEYIFKSIAYANGIYEEVKPITAKEYQSIIPKPYVNPDIPLECRTSEEIPEYLDSLIEIDEEGFTEFGLGIRQITVESVNYNNPYCKDSFIINYELLPLKPVNDKLCIIHFSLYNSRSRLINTSSSMVSLNYRKKIYIGNVFINNLYLSKIAKIKIHID